MTETSVNGILPTKVCLTYLASNEEAVREMRNLLSQGLKQFTLMNAAELSYTTLSIIENMASIEEATINCQLSNGGASAASADLADKIKSGLQICQVGVNG